MSYPEMPPVELLNQLAPDVKDYFLNKVNNYYRYQQAIENRTDVLHSLSLGHSYYFRNPEGKICVLNDLQPEDVATIKRLTKENK